MYNIFDAQDPLFDAHPTPYRSTADDKKRKARQCGGHCTGSRWAAIESGEAFRHAKGLRMRNEAAARALRAAQALDILCAEAARRAQVERHTEGMNCEGQRAAQEMPTISQSVP